jgi:hypothetical protein
MGTADGSKAIRRYTGAAMPMKGHQTMGTADGRKAIRRYTGAVKPMR